MAEKVSSYKLEICLYAPQYQPITLWCPKLRPLCLVSRINVRSEVLRPVDSSRLGVAKISDIIDMAFRWSLGLV